MTWNVSAFGKPAAVKAKLAQQFAHAKTSTVNFPHEQNAVAAVEAIVNSELDFLAERTNPSVVRVEAAGSAYKSADGTGSTQVRLEVLPMSGFVE